MNSRIAAARPKRRRSSQVLWGLLAALVLAAGSLEAQQTQQWRRWEKVLTSQNDYTVVVAGQAGNPYRDLTLIVTYTEVSSQKQFRRYGFWEGGKTFKIRGAFPGGNWTWSTVCSGTIAGKNCAQDSGLNASGSMSIETILSFPPCTGPGPCYHPYELYNRGFPAVSADGRYLTYAFGNTPFFWSADTAWQAPILATTPDWQTYVSDRLKRGFTAVLLALAPDTDWTNPVPFVNQVGCSSNDPVPNSCSIPVQSYWQGFDQKVQTANQSGLLVFIAGLNDPLDRGGPQTRNLFPRKADVERFGRNLGARLAGNFVLYSGSFDDGKNTLSVPFDPQTQQPELQEVVMKAVLAALFPSQPATAAFYPHTRQLKSIHLGGGAAYADYAAFQDVVDVQLFHSGHGANNQLPNESREACALRRSREMPLVLGNYSSGAPVAFTTPRPVGNVETLYESDNSDGTIIDCWVNGPNSSCGPQEPDTPNRVRQAGHLTSLSGAFGSTTGAGHVANEIWKTTEGIYPWVFGPSPNHFASYLDTPGAGYMQNLRALFATRPWKDLRPQHCIPAHSRCGNLIVGNDNAAGDQKAVIAVSTNWRFAIAYMPNNASLTLKTASFPSFATRWTKTWWNPRSGQALGTTTSTCSGTECTFTRPQACAFNDGPAGNCDWALLLEDTCPNCPASPPPASAVLRVGLGQLGGEEQAGIVVQVEDSEGSTQAQASADPTVLHKLPTITRSRSGRHLVAWQSENLDGSLWGVFARLFNSEGLPLGEPFQVNTETENDQTDPAASETAGQFVVTWTSFGQDGDQGGIFAQRIDAAGEPDGPEFQVNSSSAGHQGYPQVGATNSGDFVIAWESGETGSQSEAIYARRFDKFGNPLGSEIRVDSPVGTFSDLVTLSVQPLGTWFVETQRYDLSGADLGRFQRRFNLSGQPVGTETQVLPPAPW